MGFSPEAPDVWLVADAAGNELLVELVFRVGRRQLLWEEAFSEALVGLRDERRLQVSLPELSPVQAFEELVALNLLNFQPSVRIFNYEVFNKIS